MPVPETLDTKDLAPESKHIRAEDFPRNWRADLLVTDINVQEFKKDDGYVDKKFVVTFAGKSKTWIMNRTNQTFVEAALGSKPNRWIGATFTLSIGMVKYQGKLVPGFVVIGAKPAANAPAEPGAPATDVQF